MAGACRTAAWAACEYAGGYDFTSVVQQRTAQPQLSGARINCDHHDANRRVVDSDGHVARMGTRHHGSIIGYTAVNERSDTRQTGSLFHSGHGRLGTVRMYCIVPV